MGEKKKAIPVGAWCVVAALLMVGCRSQTDFGRCIGLNAALNNTGDSTVVYEISVRNLFWGIVGIEVIYPPIKVALDETMCPVARRTQRIP